ncbi:MAG: alpha/beta hydrolase, partial [Mycobacteriaceae bacterium]
MAAALPVWADDVLPGYRRRTLALGADPDGEGEIFATLIRRADDAPSQRVALAVHGFTDYFFNTELVDRFARRGYRLYGLDLHKCGRSWREGQTPHFTTDLSDYDRELELA